MLELEKPLSSIPTRLKTSRPLQVLLLLLLLAPLQYYFASRLYRHRTLRTGDPVPAARVLTQAGSEWTPGSDSGRVVILSFWASWCEPCRRELPLLDSLYARLDSTESVRFYAVNVGESRSTVKDHVRRTGLTLPVLYDSAEVASRSFAVTALPTLVVIGRDGTILLSESGFQPWLPDLIARAVSLQVDAAFRPVETTAQDPLESALRNYDPGGGQAASETSP